MKEFNIWMATDGSLDACKAPKASAGAPVAPAGFKTLITKLKAPSKTAAIAQYHARVQSGMIVPKISAPVLTEHANDALALNSEKPVNKVIFCDFNGVLDDIHNDSNESNPSFKLPQLACPEKIMRLVKLAIKHDAKIVFISEHRKLDVGLKVIIGRCLLHSDCDEFIDFYNDNRRKISELTQVRPTGSLSSRSKEIKEYIWDEDVTHCVVFEDSHPIDQELNPIMTQWSQGLQDCHIEQADKFLN